MRKLTETEQQMADKLTDAGLEQDHAESWVREVVDGKPDEDREIKREFEILRETWPALFRFKGTIYQEFYDIDTMRDEWIEISPLVASKWLGRMP